MQNAAAMHSIVAFIESSFMNEALDTGRRRRSRLGEGSKEIRFRRSGGKKDGPTTSGPSAWRRSITNDRE